jgi:hypothetical protein
LRDTQATEIALAQRGGNRHIAGEAFQVWKLTVDQDNRTAPLTCDDRNSNVVYSRCAKKGNGTLSFIVC